jgi:hemerythrin superfamily protein
MDAFTLMKNDHRKVMNLFEEINSAGSGALKKREDLFKKLKMELDAHTFMEEEVFYPRMKGVDETHDLILNSYEEHHIVDLLLKELEEMSPDDERWMAKLRVLHEMVQNHIEEEESEIFEKTREILDEEQAKEIGREMEEAKKKFV